METVSVIEQTKNYITLRIPRSIMRRAGVSIEKLSEKAALKILLQGMSEYRAGKTKTLRSLRDLRYDSSKD